MASTAPLIEIVDERALECGEGPMWDVARQRLLWTDALGEAILGLERSSGQVEVVSDELRAGSVVLHHDGPLVLSTPSGVRSWHGPGDVRDVVGEADGAPMDDLNDAIADAHGRLFTGQEKYSDEDPGATGSLFRVDLDGSAQVVEEGLGIANGMGFSPDGSTFYLVDSPVRTIHAYRFDAASGGLSKRRTLVRLEPADGLPDGLTVDEEGFLWVARWFGGGVSRFDPDGHLERTIELPVAQPSSVMFGGADLDELYVTSAAVDWRSPLEPPGRDASRRRGGPTFRIRTGIRGRPEHRAAIALPARPAR